MRRTFHWNLSFFLILSIVTMLSLLPRFAYAAESKSLWDLTSYTTVLKDLVDNATPAALFGANQKPSVAGFVPVRNWHSGDKKIVYAQSGFAGKFQSGSAPSLHLVPLTLNFFALTAKAFSWDWALKHSTAQPMPDIFFGGAGGLQLDGNVLRRIKNYNLKTYAEENLYLMLYIRGFKPKATDDEDE